MSLLSAITGLFKNAEVTEPAADSVIPFIRTDPTYKVVNAGERSVIGIYTRRTSFGLTFNGKLYFTLEEKDDSDPNGAKLSSMYYADSAWHITDAEGDIVYTGSDVETPDLAEWTVAAAGTLFLPTVIEGEEKSVLNQVAIDDLAGGVKVYRALLTQSDTDAPVATVLENTLGDIVWAYVGSGRYTATLTGSFTANKTALVLMPSASIGGEPIGFGFIGRTDADNLFVRTFSYTNLSTEADGILIATFCQILVYP